MLLTHITTNNFLGLPALDLALQPFTLIVGANGDGKTSVLEAVRFALRGELLRGVERKADLGELLTEGADKGYVEVTTDGRAVRRSVKTGEIGKVAIPAMHDLIGWQLDPSLFMRIDPAQRRTGLSGLLKVKSTPEEVLKRLGAQGLPDPVLADLLGPLGKGFEFAQKHAATRASEARGAWKALTGETYGDVKADGWAPPAPEHEPPTDMEVHECNEALRKVTAEIAGLNQQIGAASRSKPAEELAELRKTADALPDLLARRERGLTQKQGRTTTVNDLATRAAADNSGTTTPCPHCQALVVIDRGRLHKPVDEDVAAARAEAASALPAARAALEETEAGLRVLDERIRGAELAKSLLALAPAEPGESVEALTQQRDAKQARQGDLSQLQTIHRARIAERDRTAGLAERAAREHALVKHYALAADQLSPNGIPAILVAQMLEPVNAALAAAAKDANWPTVALNPHMELTFGGRPYALCSESQRWRMDAAFAFALGSLTRTPLLLLDRLDVLDPTGGRAAVLGWLHKLATTDGWQVLAAATLKAAPNIPGIHAVWVDGRTSGRLAA